MNHVLFLLLAGDPLNPNPSASADPANTFYSPGLIGFLGTFIVVIGAIALIWDMVRRIRKVNYRAQIQERLAAEKAEYEAKSGTGAETGTDGAPTKPARSRPAPPAKPKRD